MSDVTVPVLMIGNILQLTNDRRVSAGATLGINNTEVCGLHRSQNAEHKKGYWNKGMPPMYSQMETTGPHVYHVTVQE